MKREPLEMFVTLFTLIYLALCSQTDEKTYPEPFSRISLFLGKK